MIDFLLKLAKTPVWDVFPFVVNDSSSVNFDQNVQINDLKFLFEA